VTCVLAVVEDLFFGAKLLEVARHLDVSLSLVRPLEEIITQVRERRPALVILDLQGAAAQPLEAIRGIKADAELRTTRVLGFLSHVQADLRASAVEAGCDEVLPRSAFAARLPEILRPYASVGAP
jgi:DNA-binding NarL/FixJ family response regulator